MNATPLHPLGAEVHGLVAGPLDDATADEIRDLLARHGVLVLRDQHAAGNPEFLAFLRSLGDLTFTAGETHVDGYPDLNVISNVGRTTPPRSTFHVDTSYVAEPPAYTALRAVTVPAAGGETLFTDQYAALNTLDPELRDHLDGRTLRHVVTGVDPGDAQEHAAEHPLFRPHPRTGRQALYLTTPARCESISGLTADETRQIVDRLLAHSTRPENTHRHRWQPGDIVIWDNACVLHRADHTAVDGDRVMHRGMVAAHGA